MKDRLKEIKRIVEKKAGFRIDGEGRKREVTYARAVYAKIAREIKLEGRATYSLEDIGKPIKRNYATILHYLQTTFDYAMTDIKYKQIYEEMEKAFVENDAFEGISDLDAISSLADDITRISERFDELRSKYIEVVSGEDRLSKMLDGLSEEEKEEVYEMIELRVKSIKSRVYV